jgi:hypothetical protein
MVEEGSLPFCGQCRVTRIICSHCLSLAGLRIQRGYIGSRVLLGKSIALLTSFLYCFCYSLKTIWCLNLGFYSISISQSNKRRRQRPSSEPIHLVSQSFLSTPFPCLLLIICSDVKVTNISFAQDLIVTGFIGLLEIFDHLRKHGLRNPIKTEIGKLLETETQNPNADVDFRIIAILTLVGAI